MRILHLRANCAPFFQFIFIILVFALLSECRCGLRRPPPLACAVDHAAIFAVNVASTTSQWPHRAWTVAFNPRINVKHDAGQAAVIAFQVFGATRPESNPATSISTNCTTLKRAFPAAKCATTSYMHKIQWRELKYLSVNSNVSKTATSQIKRVDIARLRIESGIILRLRSWLTEHGCHVRTTTAGITIEKRVQSFYGYTPNWAAAGGAFFWESWGASQFKDVLITAGDRVSYSIPNFDQHLHGGGSLLVAITKQMVIAPRIFPVKIQGLHKNNLVCTFAKTYRPCISI